LASCEILWRFFFVCMFSQVVSFPHSSSPGTGSLAISIQWKRSSSSSIYLKKEILFVAFSIAEIKLFSLIIALEAFST
jgi:hypothetical protein